MRITTIAAGICLLGGTFTAVAQKVDFNKKYGVSGSATTGQSVCQLPGGNLLIAGTQSKAQGSGFQADILLVKTTPDGSQIWSIASGLPNLNEYAQMMDVMADGKIIVGGYVTDAVTPTNGSARLSCFDTSGVLLWEKTYSSGNGNFAINAVKAVSDGYIACGVHSTPANGNGDAWLLKTNKNGDSLWSKIFGGPEYDDSWDMEIAPDGGYILTGGNYSFADGKYDDAWIIKTDAQGNEQWKKMYGLTDRVDWAWAITPVKTNGQITGYAFTGVKDTEEDPPGNQESQLHFVKTDLQGNVVWDKSIATPTGAYRREGMDIEQLPDGGFVIAAYRVPPSQDARNLHIIKTSANGDVVWETTVGTTGEVYTARAITPTSDGGCLVTGSYFTPVPAQTVFLVKVSGLTTGVSNVAGSDMPVQVYPNPTTGSFTISGYVQGAVTLTISDAAGRTVHSETIKASGRFDRQVVLSSNLANGTYFINMEAGAQVATAKLTLQK